MGRKFQVVKRPPMVKLLTSWLNFPEIQDYVPFTIRGEEFKGLGFLAEEGGKPGEWQANIQPCRLTKSDKPGTIPGAIWFSGKSATHIGMGSIFGCLTPRNRDSWIAFCDVPDWDYFTPNWSGEWLRHHEILATSVQRAEELRCTRRFNDSQIAEALKIAEAISFDHYGDQNMGGEIVLSVLEELAQTS